MENLAIDEARLLLFAIVNQLYFKRKVMDGNIHHFFTSVLQAEFPLL
jgi:hypothetical protein